MSEETDQILILLAQKCGCIETMLDSLFSFLKRKTDFYHILEPKGKIGFPEGKAEALVLSAYRKYLKHASAPDKGAFESAQRLQSKPNPPSKPTGCGQPQAKVQLSTSVSQSCAAPCSDANRPSNRPDQQTQEGNHGSPQAAPRIQIRGEDSGFVSYNGGSGDRYKWSQTLGEVTLCVDVGGGGQALRGKDVLCTVERRRVRVGLKGGCTVVEGDLHDEVRSEDAVWSLEEGRYVTITLEKVTKTWWKRVLAGGPEIDTQKVDSTCSIDDYDEPTQAAIEKVVYDHHQKLKGLPTSEELRTQEMLRRAWDAEGSPFRGTPFDPSRVNLSSAPPE